MRPVFRKLAFGALLSAPVLPALGQTSIQEVQRNLRQIASIDKEPTPKLKIAFAEFCKNGYGDIGTENRLLSANDYYCVHQDFGQPADVLAMVDTVGHYDASGALFGASARDAGDTLMNFESVVLDELDDAHTKQIQRVIAASQKG